MNPTAQHDITAYVEGVRAALADLPEPIQLELLEDLPEHLAEVLAEGQGTLVDRLGAPSSYAAELRATAGFVGGFPDPPSPNRLRPLLDTRDTALAWLRRADTKTGPVIGYEKTSDFLALLRPAWWVLRGYLAAMAISYIVSNDGGLLPRIGGSDLVALILLAVTITGSILIGRRGATLSLWPKRAVWAATVFLAFFAFGGFVSADGQMRQSDNYYSDVSGNSYNPFSHVEDVFVYDREGRLITDARLFDQEGAPIQLGNSYCWDEQTGESRHSRNIGYPYCAERAPFSSAAPSDPPSPSVAPSPPSKATPTTTPTPTPSGR